MALRDILDRMTALLNDEFNNGRALGRARRSVEELDAKGRDIKVEYTNLLNDLRCELSPVVYDQSTDTYRRKTPE